MTTSAKPFTEILDELLMRLATGAEIGHTRQAILDAILGLETMQDEPETWYNKELITDAQKIVEFPIRKRNQLRAAVRAEITGRAK